MSFFKKLTAEFKELLSDKDDKPKEEKKQDKPAEHPDATRDYNAPSQQPNASQPQQYPPQPYGQGQHGGYGSPPPGPPGPPGQGQLPPGWTQQWDQNSQRWYYVEQATGRTQWDPPSHDRGFGYGQPPQQGYGAPMPHGGYGSTPSGQPGYNYPGAPPPQGQYGAPQYHDQGYPPGQNVYPPGQPADYHGDKSMDKEKKKSNTGKYMAAGAGGLAVGALAGAALAGDSSDEEHGARYAAQPNYYGTAGGPMAPAPVPLEDNPELSSSQRSSLEEARKDYEEARREVAEDSDPSSSDVEELQEAREEYHSEIEEAHEELEDD